jgi:hypothetical protein
MAKKLSFLGQWLGGEWADRAAINRNAEDLSVVEADVTELRKVVQQQAQELLRLRAMFMGVVEVLHTKTPFDDNELESAVDGAWKQLTAPPLEALPTTDPYRNAPMEVSAEEIAAAKALLASAEKHHFSQQFTEARTIYQQIIDRHPNTKQAATARQQLENLRRA